MHVVWRVVISVVAGCVVGSMVGYFVDKLTHNAVPLGIFHAAQSVDDRYALYPFFKMSMVVYHSLPIVIVAVVLFALLPRPRVDKETRCRRCGYILRGLTEPRCSECGERI